MTDAMCVGYSGDPLPSPLQAGRLTNHYPAWDSDPTPDPLTALEIRVRDLELVCRVQQKMLTLLAVSLKPNFAKDLKALWPEMEVADMVLNG